MSDYSSNELDILSASRPQNPILRINDEEQIGDDDLPLNAKQVGGGRGPKED
jgi:hypothetical protein